MAFLEESCSSTEYFDFAQSLLFSRGAAPSGQNKIQISGKYRFQQGLSGSVVESTVCIVVGPQEGCMSPIRTKLSLLTIVVCFLCSCLLCVCRDECRTDVFEHTVTVLHSPSLPPLAVHCASTVLCAV